MRIVCSDYRVQLPGPISESDTTIIKEACQRWLRNFSISLERQWLSSMLWESSTPPFIENSKPKVEHPSWSSLISTSI